METWVDTSCSQSAVSVEIVHLGSLQACPPMASAPWPELFSERQTEQTAAHQSLLLPAHRRTCWSASGQTPPAGAGQQTQRWDSGSLTRSTQSSWGSDAIPFEKTAKWLTANLSGGIIEMASLLIPSICSLTSADMAMSGRPAVKSGRYLQM